MRPFYLPFNKGNDSLNGFDEEDHEEFAERLRKTLYYGKHPSTDRPSLPLTEIAVEYLQEACPRQLGKLDMFTAAATSRQACMSPCSVMMSMLYIKRLKTKNPAYLQQISSSDLFLISVLMASKFLYDEGIVDEVFNDEWAASADMENEDVNEMERQFLSAIDWQLFIRPNEFNSLLDDMEKRIALRQGRQRGWFTYTDLLVLSGDPEVAKLATYLSKEISKVVVVSSAAYLASVLTMVGSTLLVTTMSTAVLVHGPAILAPPLPALPHVTLKVPHGRCCNETAAAIVDVHPNKTHDDLPETLTNEEELSKTSDRGNDGFSHLRSAVDGLLSLFAVVSLRETLVQYMCSTKDCRDGFSGSTHAKQHKHPYHHDVANPNLAHSTKLIHRQNKSVAMEYGDSMDSNEQVLSRLRGCASCEKRNSNGNGRCMYVPNGQQEKCVVDHEMVYRGFKDLTLYDRFSDIHLGFTTGLKSPVLLNT